MEFCHEAAVGLEKILVRVLRSYACVDNARVVLCLCVFAFAEGGFLFKRSLVAISATRRRLSWQQPICGSRLLVWLGTYATFAWQRQVEHFLT